MKNPYLPFYAQDWRGDPKVAMLSYEERGVFLELLTICWTLNDSCAIPDDNDAIARILHVTNCKWRKLRKALIDCDNPVLYSENGKIFSKRLQKEREKIQKTSEKNSVAAQIRWAENSANSLKNNDPDDANAMRTHMPNTCERNANQNHTQNHKDKEKIYKKEKTTTVKKRATQVPEDFQPTAEHIARAKKDNLNLKEQVELFINYYLARNISLTRWNQAFTGWLIRAAKYEKQQRGNNYGQPTSALGRTAKFHKLLDDADAEDINFIPAGSGREKII